MATSQGAEGQMQGTPQAQVRMGSPLMPIVRSPGVRMLMSPASILARSQLGSPAAMMSTSEGSSRRSRKRKLTSPIWRDFTPIYEGDTLAQAQCIHCLVVYKCTQQSGSSQCHRHVKTCKDRSEFSQMVGSTSPSSKRFKYDKDIANNELVRMIVLHELPFSIVEYEGFRRFVASLNPSFKPICRTTVKNDCLAVYEEQRLQLLDVLKNSTSRVSLTADLWSSNQGLGYMCVTCHFIDKKWKLAKRIIRFASVDTPHDGINLFHVILKTMTEWSVEDKVFGITLDNASVNDSMVNFVKSNLLGRELLVGKGEMLHHRCAAHVLNLIVQDGLKVGSAAINNIRESVLFVRSSEARRQKFKDIVAQEGIESEKSVCLDVSTRWNSTYLMTKTILVFKRAFDALASQDPAYLCAPSAEQWNLAREMVTLLEVFYNATVILSGSLYPTSNLVFHEFWKVKEVLESEATHPNAIIRSMVHQMKKKFMKYWKLMYLTICVPVILDPRFKYEYLEYLLKDDAEMEGQKYMIAVKRAFKELFNAYSSCDDGPSVDTEVVETSGNRHDRWAEWTQHIGQKQRSRTKRTELDTYLKDDVVPVHTSFDILEWWKFNSEKYPVLSRMARDILAVPASTVASESAFSTGSRVISDYRSRLTSPTVNALICLQDWMRPDGVAVVKTITEDFVYGTDGNSA